MSTCMAPTHSSAFLCVSRCQVSLHRRQGQDAFALDEGEKNRNPPSPVAFFTIMERYTVVKSLGKGSFGSASLVRRKADGLLFVVKEVNLARLSAKERDESRNEARVLQQLSHPNIVRFVEHFERRNILYIVMEYADGGDLHQKIKNQRNTRMKEDTILHYFVQLCLAVEYLHSRHILHRDIKTMNIFLTSNGTVKLGDFGISTVLRNTMAMANTVCGTPYYFSPELCKSKPYNNKSDVWALGVVLYELAMLTHPFDGTSLQQLAQRIVKSPYPSVASCYSPELKELIGWMLQKEVAKRPSIAAVLGVTLMQRHLVKLQQDLTVAQETHQRLQVVVGAPVGAAAPAPTTAAVLVPPPAAKAQPAQPGAPIAPVKQHVGVTPAPSDRVPPPVIVQHHAAATPNIAPPPAPAAQVNKPAVAALPLNHHGPAAAAKVAAGNAVGLPAKVRPANAAAGAAALMKAFQADHDRITADLRNMEAKADAVLPPPPPPKLFVPADPAAEAHRRELERILRRHDDLVFRRAAAPQPSPSPVSVDGGAPTAAAPAAAAAAAGAMGHRAVSDPPPPVVTAAAVNPFRLGGGPLDALYRVPPHAHGAHMARDLPQQRFFVTPGGNVVGQPHHAAAVEPPGDKQVVAGKAAKAENIRGGKAVAKTEAAGESPRRVKPAIPARKKPQDQTPEKDSKSSNPQPVAAVRPGKEQPKPPLQDAEHPKSDYDQRPAVSAAYLAQLQRQVNEQKFNYLDRKRPAFGAAVAGAAAPAVGLPKKPVPPPATSGSSDNSALAAKAENWVHREAEKKRLALAMQQAAERREVELLDDHLLGRRPHATDVVVEGREPRAVAAPAIDPELEAWVQREKQKAAAATRAGVASTDDGVLDPLAIGALLFHYVTPHVGVHHVRHKSDVALVRRSIEEVEREMRWQQAGPQGAAALPPPNRSITPPPSPAKALLPRTPPPAAPQPGNNRRPAAATGSVQPAPSSEQPHPGPRQVVDGGIEARTPPPLEDDTQRFRRAGGELGVPAGVSRRRGVVVPPLSNQVAPPAPRAALIRERSAPPVCSPLRRAPFNAVSPSGPMPKDAETPSFFRELKSETDYSDVKIPGAVPVAEHHGPSGPSAPAPAHPGSVALAGALQFAARYQDSSASVPRGDGDDDDDAVDDALDMAVAQASESEEGDQLRMSEYAALAAHVATLVSASRPARVAGRGPISARARPKVTAPPALTAKDPSPSPPSAFAATRPPPEVIVTEVDSSAPPSSPPSSPSSLSGQGGGLQGGGGGSHRRVTSDPPSIEHSQDTATGEPSDDAATGANDRSATDDDAYDDDTFGDEAPFSPVAKELLLMGAPPSSAPQAMRLAHGSIASPTGRREASVASGVAEEYMFRLGHLCGAAFTGDLPRAMDGRPLFGRDVAAGDAEQARDQLRDLLERHLGAPLFAKVHKLLTRVNTPSSAQGGGRSSSQALLDQARDAIARCLRHAAQVAAEDDDADGVDDVALADDVSQTLSLCCQLVYFEELAHRE